MRNEIVEAIRQLGREKKLEVETIIEATEKAYSAAARKASGTDQNFVAELDRETGEISLFLEYEVVEEVEDSEKEMTLEKANTIQDDPEIGDVVRIPTEVDNLGRIDAQVAKQVIYQKVREAEREKVYEEFSERLGEVVNGIVKRVRGGDVFLDIGKTEAMLPRREQPETETYDRGDRLRVVIQEVHKNATDSQVIVSRNSPELLIKLFEMEVPEVYDGTVQIKKAVREPGSKAKVAVISTNSDVDPVGACVGRKGARVKAIKAELMGERIDIIEWSEDAMIFGKSVLKPAETKRIHIIDEAERHLEVIVAEDQLSLAIGRRGQNVRLAAKLMDWTIDVKSEVEKRQEVEAEMDRLSAIKRDLLELPGVGDKTAETLIEAGFSTIAKLREAAEEDLAALPGFGKKRVQQIKEHLEEMKEA